MCVCVVGEHTYLPVPTFLRTRGRTAPFAEPERGVVHSSKFRVFLCPAIVKNINSIDKIKISIRSGIIKLQLAAKHSSANWFHFLTSHTQFYSMLRFLRRIKQMLVTFTTPFHASNTSKEIVK